jgi:prolyl 4-hydroxylase
MKQAPLVAVPQDNPDRQRLRRIGRKVRERLSALPEIYRIPTDQAEMFAVGEFFTPDECERLIAMIDAVAQPSRAFDAAYESGYRTSYSGDVDPNDPFVRRIQRRIDDLLGIDPSYGETIQGQRYLPGQEFQAHCDWFPVGTDYWEQEKDRGGQRSITAMAYLNAVEEGGATAFPSLGISVEPTPGALLVWNNADPDGNPNPWVIHAGTPVVRGVKYIITKWYRTGRWV